MSIEINYIWER